MLRAIWVRIVEASAFDRWVIGFKLQILRLGSTEDWVAVAKFFLWLLHVSVGALITRIGFWRP